MKPDPAAQMAIIRSYIADFELYARECLVIKNHNTAELIPLALNSGQRILHRVAEKQKKECGYVRVILDKARRIGGSTYVEGRYYWRCSLNFNRNAFIIAHEEDSTNTLFSMARLFHERNPIAPPTRYSNKKELIFDTAKGRGLKSEYSLACARNTDAGRSQGIHYLHGSEVAFWPDADTLLDGIMACVPPPPAETEIFLESTGNGFGNRFQKDVFSVFQEGKYPYYQEDGITYAWMSPGNEWVLVFIPWFVHEIYRRDFQTSAQREEFEKQLQVKVLNKEMMVWEECEALKLQKKYSLSLEQLHWREWAIENIFKGRIEKFRQEFPATVEESFLSKGSNVYPKELCDALDANCRSAIYTGDLVERMGKAQIKLNQYGHLSMWERPDMEKSYFMTIDPGGGLKDSQKKEKREPDPTAMDMWERKTGLQVAQWHGDIDYDLIADTAELFGRLYGHYEDGAAPVLPPACVELQNHGFTVVADLKRLHYPMFEAKEGEGGWLTTSKSKPVMVDGLYSCARNGSLQLMCRETVSEMRTYIEESGRFSAESGCHDDRVMSAAMASQMMLLLPVVDFNRKTGKRRPGGFSNWNNRSKGSRWDGNYHESYVE